jgi:uncharacterized protein (DUF2336 family)
MTSAARSLIIELNAAVSRASESWRSELLRRVTDLFIGSIGSYSRQQTAIFDDILCRLIEKVEPRALIELSARLAPLASAPPNVVNILARNENTAIAGPLLEASSVLDEEALSSIAANKRHNLLTFIAARRQVPVAISDVLIDRGSSEVAQRIVDNQGAQISERGFVKLIGLAKTDKALALAIAIRQDLPPELVPFLKLALGRK